LLARGLVQGCVVLIAALGVFFIGIKDVHGDQVARSMAFITLVLGNLGLVLTNRSIGTSAFNAMLRPNKALGLVFIITLLALILALTVPKLRELFQFAPLGPEHIAEGAGAALISILVNDLCGIVIRWIRRLHSAGHSAQPHVPLSNQS
jgi:magnesium-transporting ATPase (P-type)